jgi:hypothetical protein
MRALRTTARGSASRRVIVRCKVPAGSASGRLHRSRKRERVSCDARDGLFTGRVLRHYAHPHHGGGVGRRARDRRRCGALASHYVNGTVTQATGALVACEWITTECASLAWPGLNLQYCPARELPFPRPSVLKLSQTSFCG